VSTQAHRYHPGESAAQERAGLVEQAEYSRGAIGATIPPPARAFLTEQPMLVVGAADRDGRMWASLLTGRPGFLSVSGPQTLEIAARPVADDPLARVLDRPTMVGALALEPATRRRMRINGRSTPITTPHGGGLRVTADQVYANCPKYIQARHPHETGDPAPPVLVSDTRELTGPQQAWLEHADTFFVATRSAAGDADASHRGGNPGFVQVRSASELVWPDYIGNAMLMTLGNLQQDAAAGLLAVDWDSGATLQLTGRATVDWDAPETLPGAQRAVRFHLEQAVQIAHAGSPAWSAPTYSRHNPAPGPGTR
jgi:uncharacterized protein